MVCERIDVVQLTGFDQGRRAFAYTPQGPGMNTLHTRLQSISQIQQSSIVQARKNPGDLVSRYRSAIQITLNLNAAFEVQTSHLLLSLNTFGGGDHAKAHAKARDGADNSKASLVDE